MNLVYKIITGEIVDRMNRGEVPWRKRWNGGTGISPLNFVTKTEYHGINVMLLGMQGWERPFWATYKQVDGIGGRLKKGEGKRGTMVVYWKQYIDEVIVDSGDVET